MHINVTITDNGKSRMLQFPSCWRTFYLHGSNNLVEIIQPVQIVLGAVMFYYIAL